jgi:hypothetical protein
VWQAAYTSAIYVRFLEIQGPNNQFMDSCVLMTASTALKVFGQKQVSECHWCISNTTLEKNLPFPRIENL